MQRCEAGEWWEASDAQTAMDGNGSQAGQSQRSPSSRELAGRPLRRISTIENDLDYSCAYPLRPQALSPKQVRRCPETGAFRNEPAVCTSRFGVVPTRPVSVIEGSVRHVAYV